MKERVNLEQTMASDDDKMLPIFFTNNIVSKYDG